MLRQGKILLAVAVVPIAIVVVQIPDKDMYVFPEADIRKNGDIRYWGHRGATHTIPFAVLGGVIAIGLVYTLFYVSTVGVGAEGVLPYSPGEIAAIAGLSVTFSLLSHIAADAITPVGVKPYMPLSRKGWYKIVKLDKSSKGAWNTYDNMWMNYGFFVLGAIVLGLIVYATVDPDVLVNEVKDILSVS